MKRRVFLAAGTSLAACAALRGWTAAPASVGDVAARSLDGADVSLPGKAVEDFAARLDRGPRTCR